MASATTTTETWHPLLAQHLNLLPEHLRSHKDCQAFLLELNNSDGVLSETTTKYAIPLVDSNQGHLSIIDSYKNMIGFVINGTTYSYVCLAYIGGVI